jgi:hypothetical protein
MILAAAAFYAYEFSDENFALEQLPNGHVGGAARQRRSWKHRGTSPQRPLVYVRRGCEPSRARPVRRTPLCAAVPEPASQPATWGEPNSTATHCF